MSPLLTRLGVKRTLGLVLLAAAVITAALTTWFLGRSMSAALRDVAVERARAEGRRAGAELAPALAEGKDDAVSAALARSPAGGDLAYLLVVRSDFSPVAARVGEGAALDAEGYRRLHTDRGLAAGGFEVPGAVAVTEPVVAAGPGG